MRFWLTMSISLVQETGAPFDPKDFFPGLENPAGSVGLIDFNLTWRRKWWDLNLSYFLSFLFLYWLYWVGYLKIFLGYGFWCLWILVLYLRSCDFKECAYLCRGCKFSADEERVVIELQAQFGNKWAKIATYLEGRTDNDVKNFWSTRRKRLERILQTPPQKSQKNKQRSLEPQRLHELPALEVKQVFYSS